MYKGINYKRRLTFTEGATHVDLLPTKVKFGFTLAEGVTHVNLLPIKARFGFTLAEVLITLGIIGVVAAMTIPTLIANTRSAQYRSTLKKTMSTLSQAARMSQAQYGFDFAGIDAKCGANGGEEKPTTVMSMCSLLNGTLTGATYYDDISKLPMTKNNENKKYALVEYPYFKSLYGTGFVSNMRGYVLSDGVIVAFYKDLGYSPCTLPVGVPFKDGYITGVDDSFMSDCVGFIDVNGTALPNKEVSCSSGSSSVTANTCVVKNDAKHLTDIYPIRFHDGIIEPATAAARYVLRTAK